MKHIVRISCLVFLFLSSCSLFELDENLENPNEVGIDNLDVNLLMNQIQAEFGDFFAQANEESSELARHMALIGGDTYERAYQAQDMDDVWNRAYQDVLIQIETLLESTDGTGRTAHSGVARILKAYTLLTLVDLFGDVPYSAALKGADGDFNPGVDPGEDVYADAIALLDEAITLLGQAPTIGLSRDIFYGGDRAKWTALANTLKLKAYLNMRLTEPTTAKTQIEALLNADLIDSDGEEFTYKYSNADIPARSRHPLYQQMYQPVAGNADGYIGNYMLYITYKDPAKDVEDPRWRYYFFRQVGSIDKALDLDGESIPCVISPRPSHYSQQQAWCVFDPGFFGREHGNSDGIPPDGFAMTTVGVYPAGGAVDTNTDPNFAKATQRGQGANGAGIEPIWMANFTEFVKAEAALMLKTPGDPKALMLSGVQKSIDRVEAFGATKGQTVAESLQPSEEAYINAVTALYDAAADDDDRLNVIGKEYYIALWGNGVEAYNLYRRTGKPEGIQPMRAASPGNFLRSLPYPAEFINLNSSTQQKSNTAVNKVWWDNNPDNFIY